MTEQQIAWCATHDWFVGVNEDDSSIEVRDTLVYRDGTVTRETFRWVDTFAALRAWAGY